VVPVSFTCHPKRSLLCGVAAGFINALGGRDTAKRTRGAGPISDGKRRTSQAIRPTAPFLSAIRVTPDETGLPRREFAALATSLRVEPQNDPAGEAGRSVDSQGNVNPGRSGMRRRTDMPTFQP
jgi:hypothetical protein